MLGTKDAMATIAVRNLETAKTFYGGTLGLKKVDEEMDDVVTYRSGKSTIVVYESKFSGTNKATWGVGDELETIVSTLKKKGVPFEHYDLPGLERDGDIHRAGDFRAAWFRDPNGNILHINSEASH